MRRSNQKKSAGSRSAGFAQLAQLVSVHCVSHHTVGKSRFVNLQLAVGTCLVIVPVQGGQRELLAHPDAGRRYLRLADAPSGLFSQRHAVCR